MPRHTYNTELAEFTTDTRKQHCPIRIVYCGADPAVGPVHASELTDRIYLQRDHVLAIIKATEHSDYSGSTVEASNYVCLQELSVKEPGTWPLVQIYGSHGYQALAYDATLGPVPPTWELCNALDGFENHYPVFDDDHHSALEMELETEAWGDYGRRDFRKALVSLLDDLDPDHEHEIPDDDEPTTPEMAALLANDDTTWKSLLNGLWSTGCDEFNINGGSGCVIETGCVVHFYIDEWCAAARSAYRHAGNKRWPMVETLLSIAKATRIVDETPASAADATGYGEE